MDIKNKYIPNILDLYCIQQTEREREKEGGGGDRRNKGLVC